MVRVVSRSIHLYLVLCICTRYISGPGKGLVCDADMLRRCDRIQMIRYDLRRRVQGIGGLSSLGVQARKRKMMFSDTIIHDTKAYGQHKILLNGIDSETLVIRK